MTAMWVIAILSIFFLTLEGPGDIMKSILKNTAFIAMLMILLFCSCRDSKNADLGTDGGKNMEIKITSSAFADGQLIPTEYTCDGEDISPPLQWETVPDGTLSIALICDDPDAPMGTFVHWVLYNLPPQTGDLPENFPDDETFEDGTRQGITDFGKTGYGGPCPPSGTHRYFFKIYALDVKIDLAIIADKPHLVRAMESHILGQGQLMGKYKRK